MKCYFGTGKEKKKVAASANVLSYAFVSPHIIVVWYNCMFQWVGLFKVSDGSQNPMVFFLFPGNPIISSHVEAFLAFNTVIMQLC